MRSSPRLGAFAFVSAALLVACACKKAGPGAASSSTDGLSGDAVVATYGAGKKITARELDEEVGDQIHQARTRALDKMIIEDLVKTEAAKKNMTEEQWLKSEVESKVPNPPEDEVKKMFEASASRLPPGAKYEDYKDDIISFMTGQQRQEQVRSLIEDLRKKNNIQILLKEPPKPRKQVAAKGPSRGPENAKVTIVEFSDFECPFCGKAHDTVEEVMKAYAGKVRLVFRQFPLDFHKNAQKAAEASLCAHEQGKFWEYHDLLFKNREKLAVEDLKAHATETGLDAAKFNECLDSGKQAKQVADDMAEAKKVGVSGTPAFFINGVMLSGALPFEEFKKVIDAELTGTN
jgi:protein-disulfide isomerase